MPYPPASTLCPPTFFRKRRAKREFLRSPARQDPQWSFGLLSTGVPQMLLLPLIWRVPATQTKTPASTPRWKWDPLMAFQVFVPCRLLQTAPKRRDPRSRTKGFQTMRTPTRIAASRYQTLSCEGRPRRRRNSWLSAGHFSTATHTTPTDQSSFALIQNTNSHDRLIRSANVNTRG